MLIDRPQQARPVREDTTSHSTTEMNQRSFASAEYAMKKKQTRREKLLADMERAVLWSRLIAVIEPLYPTSRRVGRHRAEPVPVDAAHAVRWHVGAAGRNAAVATSNSGQAKQNTAHRIAGFDAVTPPSADPPGNPAPSRLPCSLPPKPNRRKKRIIPTDKTTVQAVREADRA